MFYKPLSADDDDIVISPSPKKLINSSMQSFISGDNFTSAKNSFFITRNLCFLPLDTVMLPNVLAIVSIILVFTLSSTYDDLLSSTYHDILHFLPLMVLFSIHISYVLTSNPYDS